MDEDAEESFRAFVAARSTALLRTAYVLTGDQHRAEDLVQSVLAKTAAKWSGLRNQGNPEAYVRRALYHEQVSFWRRRARRPEWSVPEVPDHSRTDDSNHATELRLVVAQALTRLTPKQRAVLTLRFLDDLPEAEVAACLGVTVGTVRSQTHRALAKLREVAPELRHLAPQSHLTTEEVP